MDFSLARENQRISSMRVKGLNGREYTWSLPREDFDPDRVVSGPHLAARTLLRKMFSLDRVIEEAVIPSSSGQKLDFFVPRLLLAVEVHGEQHYKHKSFFHELKTDFLNARRRDKEKKEWCELNNITLVELPYDRTSEWSQLILKSFTGEDR